MRTLKGLLNLTKRSVRWIVLLVVLLAIAYGYYILFIRNPYTTDAYLQGNWVKVAARVKGPIVKLYAHNNEIVHKGQLLFEIDPTTYALKVKLAQAQLHEINQQLKALIQEIRAAEDVVAEKIARLKYAEIEYKRFKLLSREDAVSVRRFNAAASNFVALQAARLQAIHTVLKLREQLDSLETNGKKKEAEATLALAKKYLSYTKIYARSNGMLSNFYVREGDYIKVGESLFSIVENDYWWVQANYLEYELRRIRPGQTADLVLSMYPGHVFKGVVTAIGPGISRGRNISLQNTLPVVQESINWLRLFSRFPVFIHIEEADKDYPLRVGATAAVIVHVR